MAEFGGIPAIPPTQRDSGFAPRTVMWRVAGERLHSTQLRRSKTSFRISEAVVHEVWVPTAERP